MRFFLKPTQRNAEKMEIEIPPPSPPPVTPPPPEVSIQTVPEPVPEQAGPPAVRPENQGALVLSRNVQFTTDPKSWKKRPIDFPEDVWPSIKRMKFTNGIGPKPTENNEAEMKEYYGKHQYYDLYGMIKNYLVNQELPPEVREGGHRKPGEDAMIRQTRKAFVETMKAFRYNAAEDKVVVLDYDDSRAEKGKVWDENLQKNVLVAIKNPMRSIGTVRAYVVVPESEWQTYLEKIYPDVQKNAHRGRDSLYNNLTQNLIGIPRSVVTKFIQNQEYHQVVGRNADYRVTNPLRPRFAWQHVQECFVSDIFTSLTFCFPD